MPNRARSTARLISKETKRAHRATWFVYGGPHGEKIRPARGRKYHRMGWDVTCSCNWESRTGGAAKGSVAALLQDHRHLMQANAGEAR